MPVTLYWRKNEYEFIHQTRGKLIEKETRNSTVDVPIWGADTESVLLEGGRYEVQCITLSGAEFGEHLEWLPSRASAFDLFCKMMIRAWTAEQEPEQAVCYFHNLEYDWLQLVKDHAKLLALAKVGVSPAAEILVHRVGSWEVYLDKNCIFMGNAPFIKLKFRLFGDSKKKGRSGATFRLHLYDTFSYFPQSLERLAKDLELDVQKQERQEDIGLRDFRTEPDNEDKQYFSDYAKIDAKVTRLAGERIRDLHRMQGFYKLKPSAPSYAISCLYADLPEGVEIKNGSDNPKHLQIALDAYRGGRTGGIYHGAVSDLWVLDFHSSYPASMCSLPSFSPSMAYIDLENLELDYVMEILSDTGNAFLRVSGRETNAQYPSLLTTIGNKLCPVYGEFENIATTGYEFVAGVKSGGLQDIVVHECVVLLDMEDDVYLPFREFAMKGYAEKEQAIKGALLYIAAKLKLNSAYGKLIESRMQKLLGLTDNQHALPYLEGMEKDFAEYYYQAYLEFLERGGDENEFIFELTAGIYEEFDMPEEAWLYQGISDFNVSGFVYGKYVVPAAASLITGCSRARLFCAMKATGALYWDTDSIFVENGQPDKIAAELAAATEWLPANALPLTIGESLGEMDIELRNATGYLAGTKRYHLKGMDGDKEKVKKATHGIPALDSSMAGELIKALATGSDFGYTSRAKPTKAKEAENADVIGMFRSRHYMPKFRLDARLKWTQSAAGWAGTVIPYNEQNRSQKEKENELEQRRLHLLEKLIVSEN